MTDDLVQKLRGAGAVALGRDEQATCKEAADEIERLRAEVATLRDQLAPFFRYDGVDELRQRAEHFERELAELRERIESGKVGYIRDEHDGCLFVLDTHGTWAQVEQQEESFSTWLGKGKRVRLLVEE